MQALIKVLLSLFLVFHLAAITLLPNPSFIITKDLERVLGGYGSTLGIHTPWRFFAPNPGLHRYLEIELVDDREHEVINFQWPPKDRDDVLAENYARRVYHSILVTASMERMQNFFVPWVCRSHPGTRRFSVRVLFGSIPSLQKAVIEEPERRADMTEDQLAFPVQEFDCPGEGNIDEETT